jgi:hypothetical protein
MTAADTQSQPSGSNTGSPPAPHGEPALREMIGAAWLSISARRGKRHPLALVAAAARASMRACDSGRLREIRKRPDDDGNGKDHGTGTP